jgi:hypothetical protein
VFNTFLTAIYQYCCPFFSDPALFAHQFPLYADLVYPKLNGAATNVWEFIDSTMQRMCRPQFQQQVLYSGHKTCHGIKFQSGIVPDDLIACFYGPVPASRHDSQLLRESNLIKQLWHLFNGQPTCALYGDAAYWSLPYCFGGFCDAVPNSPQADGNREMPQVRQSVEWMFDEIVTLWTHIDMKRKMKLLLFQLASMVCIQNKVAHFYECTCEYGKMSVPTCVLLER